ncbi:MAG: filamentous hemagglutinin family protein [Gammaproteobacteria bacterium]
MNANLFRLVFNKGLGMLVPAWEGARTRQPGGGRRNRAGKHAALGGGMLLVVLLPVHAELPVPCGGGLCGTNPALNLPFETSGRADYAVAGAKGTVNQLDPRVILNWGSFNIGAGNSVEFKQPDSGSVALNHIWQSDASRIAGALSANGQVYLINQNGILFDKGAQIDVGGLIASSLNVSDAQFKSGGLFSQTGTTPVPSFAGGGNGGIVVDVDASLTARPGGKIMLFAPTVENRGRIEAPDGQVILGAGQKVYLRGSSDVNLRGLLVEVDAGGTATNAAGGTIIAERGNITLMGLAVNQMGRLSATTTVRANGSIRLLARDTVVAKSDVDTTTLHATHTGEVKLGAGSVTEVRPQLGDAATIDDSVAFSPSRVDIMGKTVHVDGNIVAPGGVVAITAVDDPSVYNLSDPAPARTPPRSDGGVYLGASSQIDVSGTRDVKELELPMSRNQLSVELRGDELKDFPVQRNGILRGKTVTIDARTGTPVADVSKYIAAIPRGVAEKTAVGGSVDIKSQGDIVMQGGAKIDISGGRLHYLDGYISTTKLVSQGVLYDIGNASPDRVYDGIAGVYSRQSNKWGVKETFGLDNVGQFSPEYIEGKDAGTISFKGYGLVLDGDFRGSATAGLYQREAGKLPLGGKLIVDDYLYAGGTNIHDVIFQTGPSATGDLTNGPVTAPLAMSTDFLVNGGFSRMDFNRNGRIDVPVDLRLPEGGELKLSATTLDINANITVPAGTISLGANGGKLTVGAGKVISARGMWVNDMPQMALGNANGPALIKGGTITVQTAKDTDLILGELDAGILRPATLDVTGGGWLSAGRQLKKGKGGDITIDSGGRLMLGAALQGLAPGGGGTLKLAAPEILIKDGAPLATPAGLLIDPAQLSRSTQLTVPSWIFNRLGFASYVITANGSAMQTVSKGDLVVAAGTTITLQAPYLDLGTRYVMQSTGADIRDFAQLAALPEQRTPVSLTLNHSSALDGSRLRMETGSLIQADPGAKIALSTQTGMVIDGQIDAPAGAINLSLNADLDYPFQPAQAIWLGRDSGLLSRGAVSLQPNAQGTRKGEVLPGGTVNINAKRGYVVAEAGSVIDVSGTQTNLDLPGADGTSLANTPVASSAGSIKLTAAEGMLLDGELTGKAGSGASAAGGTLALTLTTVNRVPGTTYAPPSGDRDIVLRAGDAMAIPGGLAAGQAIPDALNGQALFNVNKLASAGFDRFSAKSDNQIQLQGDVDINLKRSIVLDAPALNVLGGKASLSAAYVALGSSDLMFQAPPAATGGEGTLTARADLIELIGSSSLQGVKEANLESRGDIRLRGIQPSTTANNLAGSFAVADNLNLQARQVYPTTLSEFNITSGNGTVQILPNSDAAPVLSAGGKLTMTAPHIVNKGVLKAPLGEIALNATGDAGDVILDAGSQTSVSAEGQLIPYGKTQNGTDWVYDVSGNLRAIGAPPQKAVRLTGANVDLRSGAKVNLSGGGDLYAYEFVPGPTGSRDVLASNTSYAILPGLGVSPAPFDQQYYKDSNLMLGDSVYLSGGAGLKQGFYTLLPARYALLPGAYLVTAQGGYRDIAPGQSYKLANGSEVLAGKLASGSDVLDSRWSGFAVTPGDAARRQAQYNDNYAGAFFTAQAAAASNAAVPELPGDAGTLAIAAGKALRLDATLSAAHAADGRGAAVDISATRLAIVSPQTAGSQAEGFVTIDAASLSRLGASSLLLGGTRQQITGGPTIRVNSEQIVVANDAANTLTAPEVILAATGQVQVKAGSVIQGKGNFSGTPKDIQIGDKVDPANSNSSDIDGNGALLRVSSGGSAAITRLNADGSHGALDVESGSVLEGKSVALDATAGNTFKGALNLQENGALAIGAGRISLGETSAVTSGLVFSKEQLAALNKAANLTLRSYSTLDLWGDVALGGVDAGGKRLLAKLSLEAGGINGYANAGKTARINAGEVTFSNPSKIATADTPDGLGKLAIGADQITLGEGDKKIQGFSQVDIAAGREITGQGKGTLDVMGNLTLEAGRLGAAKRADQTYSASGDVAIVQAAPTADLPTASALAANLSIIGASIRDAGRIELPVGKVTLTARDGDVILTDGAQINATGLTKTFDGVPVSAPAGKVSLVSVKGNVEVQNGASVDVSGAESGGDAGALNIGAAAGTAHIAAGTLKGTAVTAAGQEQASLQGTFTLDVATLDDFSTLNTALNLGATLDKQGNRHATGGFTEARDLRVRSGDVMVAATDTVRAHDFKLTADSGKIDVQGTVDASGAKGGHIALSAQGDVVLHAGSTLDAHATADNVKGGKVELATTAGVIDVQDKSVIDVSSQAGAGGRVALRAPRNGADVNVASLAGTIKGADTVTVEAVKVYTASSINTARFNTWRNETLAYMDDANVDAIKARLGKTSDPAFHVAPGIEVQSTGDLTLANDWDLSGWRFGAGNEPGVLTLRAVDNLNLRSSLSDGFSGVTPASLLKAGPSWSYRLAGGADLGSADPLAILPAAQLANGKGDVAISAGKLVRTGTGDIDVAAARNFELGKDASGINKSNAALYTAGEPSAPEDKFPVPTGSGISVNYPVNGGDIHIRAGNDVKGAVTHQLITEWLQRRGQTNANDGTIVSGRNTSWWINFGKFAQNVGALGGGDVSVNAGGNIDNLSVVIPTTGRLPGVTKTLPDSDKLVVTGGGDMSIDAGGDIRSGVFYVGKGMGLLQAGGSIVAGRKVADTNPADTAYKDLPVHTILALGDGKFDVRAAGDVQIETILNPTVVAQDTSVTSNAAKTYFFTYSPSSAAAITSVAGDVTFANNLDAIEQAVAKGVGTLKDISFIKDGRPTTDRPMLQVYPGSLTARALEGNIVVQNSMTLFPSPAGNLRLFADGNVVFGDKTAASATESLFINLSDADPALLVNPLYIPVNPGGQVVLQDTIYRLGTFGAATHASTPIHLQDIVPNNEPVQVVANTGDINGAFYLAKQARFYAGRDIKNIFLWSQNVAQSDVTSLTAQRDIFFNTPRDASTGAQIQNVGQIYLGGPGRLDIQAGHNVDLGNSTGIVSRGNLDNPSLPARGADVTVMAGVAGQADYGLFIEKYFDPANTLTAQDYKYSGDLAAYIKQTIKLNDKLANPTDAQALQEFKRTVTAAHLDELTSYMKTLTKNDALAPDQALAAFKALTPEQQKSLIIKAFYDELKAAGRAYTPEVGSSAYSRGYEAIASLFPGEAHGDISLLFSQIKTESGGDINLLVPGGGVNAGQTTPPAESGSAKVADQLGIVAQDTGAVRAFVKGDFAVNESRVFTLRGGDILIWSSEGNIDAGKGAKTAVSAPPPVVITLPNGQTITKFSSVSGSGIRSILAGTDIMPGDVDLIAPKGVVNAGDAGIGAAGGLWIPGTVIGGDNITAGGKSNVPAPDAGSLAGTLSGVSNIGADTSKIAEKATQDLSAAAANPVKTTFRPSFLTVEVIGFGD